MYKNSASCGWKIYGGVIQGMVGYEVFSILNIEYQHRKYKTFA